MNTAVDRRTDNTRRIKPQETGPPGVSASVSLPSIDDVKGFRLARPVLAAPRAYFAHMHASLV